MSEYTDDMPNFDRYLNGELSPQEQAEFEQLCQQNPMWAERLATAKKAAQDASQYHNRAVPKWDAAATFAPSERNHWWQWQGLPAMSFCTSMLAIVMVVAKVNVQMQDGALTISFADSQQQQQKVERLVEERLEDFRQQQQQMLVSYSQDMREQQLASNAQLSQYLLESSRTERREDFAELIKFVNQQRSDDQLFYARQLNRIQEKLQTPGIPE